MIRPAKVTDHTPRYGLALRYTLTPAGERAVRTVPIGTTEEEEIVGGMPVAGVVNADGIVVWDEDRDG